MQLNSNSAVLVTAATSVALLGVQLNNLRKLRKASKTLEESRVKYEAMNDYMQVRFEADNETPAYTRIT